MADISVLVANITCVVVEIIFMEKVITFSSVANITHIKVEITFKVAVFTSSVVRITFVVNETIFKVTVIFFSGKYNFCSDRDYFLLADISFLETKIAFVVDDIFLERL